MDRRAFVRMSYLSLLMLGATATFGCSRKTVSPGGHSSDDLKTLTVDEVQARISAHDGKTFVYDNNPKDRYTESHVPTARWVDFKKVTQADLPVDKAVTLVFYCANSF